MNTCRAVPAPQDVKPCDGQPSEPGTGRAPGSGQDAPTLSDVMIALIHRLDMLIEQNAQLIEMVLSEGEQADDQPPSHYLSGSRIS